MNLSKLIKYNFILLSINKKVKKYIANKLQSNMKFPKITVKYLPLYFHHHMTSHFHANPLSNAMLYNILGFPIC